MTAMDTMDAYGVLTEPTTLTLHRLLPGPVERVWSYLTDSDLRRKWFASGVMDLTAGAPFALTWRNDELTDPPGTRPEGNSIEHTMDSRVIAVEPNKRLTFTFGQFGEVTFDLEPRGSDVMLTLTHQRLTADRGTRLKISAGWHTHLDILAACVAGKTPNEPFWDQIKRLQADYDKRQPA